MNIKIAVLYSLLSMSITPMLSGMEEGVAQQEEALADAEFAGPRGIYRYNPDARPAKGILKNRQEAATPRPVVSPRKTAAVVQRLAPITPAQVWVMHMPRGRNSFVWFENEHMWQQMPQHTFRFLTKQNSYYAQDERIGLVPVAVARNKQKNVSEDGRQYVCLAGPQIAGDGRTLAHEVVRRWETTRVSLLAWWCVHKYRVTILSATQACPANEDLGMARIAYKALE